MALKSTEMRFASSNSKRSSLPSKWSPEESDASEDHGNVDHEPDVSPGAARLGPRALAENAGGLPCGVSYPLTCSSLDPKQDPKIHAGPISGGQVKSLRALT